MADKQRKKKLNGFPEEAKFKTFVFHYMHWYVVLTLTEQKQPLDRDCGLVLLYGQHQALV